MNRVVRVHSGSLYGIEALDVSIETVVSYGQLPTFLIVGLGDKAVDEARERVKTAIKHSGFTLSPGKIVVNLIPAHIQKQGTQFDLGIAIGILASQGDIDLSLESIVCVGELSLDGKVRKITGALPFVLSARARGYSGVIFPRENLPEVSSVSGIALYPVDSLSEVVIEFAAGKTPFPTAPVPFSPGDAAALLGDFADVSGQAIAKRALEIAAAGGHNILLSGVPGAGKTMLARAFTSILPPLTEEEAIEITRIYSVANALDEYGGLLKERPFRSPHHSTSLVGLIGGGSRLRPGEISLAHRGVLFLDEFAEFSRSALEGLRQPLEDGVVSIARASGSLTYPSRFTLLAAVNPCPCGYLGSRKRPCRCAPGAIEKYRQKLSGPILDRIDLHVAIAEVEVEKLAAKATNAEHSSMIRKRVMAAREKQSARYASLGILTNAEISSKLATELCICSQTAKSVLLHAVDSLGLSARSYFKLLKICQTIADLDGEPMISDEHAHEALSYRPQELHGTG